LINNKQSNTDISAVNNVDALIAVGLRLRLKNLF